MLSMELHYNIETGVAFPPQRQPCTTSKHQVLGPVLAARCSPMEANFQCLTQHNNDGTHTPQFKAISPHFSLSLSPKKGYEDDYVLT